MKEQNKLVVIITGCDIEIYRLTLSPVLFQCYTRSDFDLSIYPMTGRWKISLQVNLEHGHCLGEKKEKRENCKESLKSPVLLKGCLPFILAAHETFVKYKENKDSIRRELVV
ncbi:hypothetical protein llap_1583 [Limosa lapponica baueri]|uniref:Uncharacterized protein n=1 Tax=Limosa lapponica baueri TaxID=1758121 RepID=A0A2I0UPZ1_LIMLA|nr:hypothetical protein llap_1583 [Limosa lapponica baueri]